MFTPDSIYRNQEVRLGTVIQSDPSTNKVIIQDDKFNTLIQISLHLHDDVAVFPAVGEKWMVNRRGGTDWFLGKRMDTPTEPLPFSGLSSGDRRLSTTGKIYLIANEIVVSGTLVNTQFSTLQNEVSTLSTEVVTLSNTISHSTANSKAVIMDTPNTGTTLRVRAEGTDVGDNTFSAIELLTGHENQGDSIYTNIYMIDTSSSDVGRTPTTGGVSVVGGVGTALSVKASAGSGTGAYTAAGYGPHFITMGDSSNPFIMIFTPTGLQISNYGDFTIQLEHASKNLVVLDHTGFQKIFQINQDGSLHGKTGKSLTFDL